MKPELQKLYDEVLKDYKNVVIQKMTKEKQISMIDDYVNSRNLGSESLALCSRDRAEYQDDLNHLNKRKRDYEEIMAACSVVLATDAILQEA